MADNAAAEGPIALARSPIPVAPPETEAAGWAVSDRRADGPLTIADWTPIAKVLLRTARVPTYGRSGADDTDHDSELTRVTDLGVRYGGTARVDGDGVGVLVIGWSPDEWLALGPPGSQPALRDRLGDAEGTVVDVTHAYAVLRVTGDQAADVLARECALDLSDAAAPDGTALRTAVSGVAAGVIRDDSEATPSYLITCEWSHGHYLCESLLDSGREYGVELDGLRITQSQWALRNARER
jgi:heterotetrameric sarcosine oxidase gamma subunit